MVLLAFIVGALLALACYVLLLRPILERRGWVRALPSGVGSMRDRFAAWVRGSATVLVGKLMTAFGTLLEIVIQIGKLFDETGIRAQLEAVGLGRNFSIALIVFGLIVTAARMRKGSANPV